MNSVGIYSNKSKNLGELAIPKSYINDFLRGHLDGDGYTYSYWDSRWKNSFMLYTVFVSGSKNHINWLQNVILDTYQLKGKIKQSRNVYQLVFAKKASVKLLGEIYYKRNLVCLERKRFKITQALGIIASV